MKNFIVVLVFLLFSGCSSVSSFLERDSSEQASREVPSLQYCVQVVNNSSKTVIESWIPTPEGQRILISRPSETHTHIVEMSPFTRREQQTQYLNVVFKATISLEESTPTHVFTRRFQMTPHKLFLEGAPQASCDVFVVSDAEKMHYAGKYR